MRNVKLGSSTFTTKVMGRPCVHLEEVDSTNLEAVRLAETGAAHGTLIWAEQQMAGKGRRGRSWNSPPGASIYMSLLLRPEISPEHASMLTLVMGLVAAKACNDLLADYRIPGNQSGQEEAEALRVQLKWPNDLVLNGKKIAGILTEMHMEDGKIRDVIIGVGINVNTREFPEDLPMASSLLRELQSVFHREKTLQNEAVNDKGCELEPLDREMLVKRCMEQFEIYYDRFVHTEDFSGLKEDYERLLVNRGRVVRVLEPAGEYQGNALGINDQGELLVEREDGEITAVYAGEVSVRGVYGYV